MSSKPHRVFRLVFWNIPLCLGAVVALAGCVSTASYRIISKQQGANQTNISVEVPATSTQGNMQTWANHLETIYKTDGKSLFIDFYASGNGAKHLMGIYEGGSVHRVHE